MKVAFQKGHWENSLHPVYTSRYDETPDFIQEETYITNQANPNCSYGFDHTSLLTKEQYGNGATVTTQCLFEKFGAPLILLTDKLYQDENGVWSYRNYYEVVLYEDGLNVWYLYPEQGETKWHKLLGVHFPVKENEIHSLSVKILDRAIEIFTGDEKVMLRIPELPAQLHVGITDCEGINKFYSFEVAES